MNIAIDSRDLADLIQTMNKVVIKKTAVRFL